MGRIWKINPSEIPSEIEFSSIHNWDSVGHVDLMLELEKEFKIDINNETLTQLTSLKKIVAFINGSDE
ncbi:MAG: acyl carrier protein [Candidatus Omnitrophota bacterium]|nr:MAG: acyl carrier protein [Candidatus Omnitrophota bacterium]